jgi:major type 1 subunit fimbrin (pilin)
MTSNQERRMKHVIASCLLMAGVGMTHGAFAQTTVNVNGNITGTCSVTSPTNITINLGSVPATDFKGAGTWTTTSPTQNLVLSCTGNPGVTMTMSGTQATGAPNTVLALTGAGGAGVATNVGVQILNNGTSTSPTTPLVLNLGVTIPSGASITIPIAARYYAITSAPGAGTANAVATVNFTFN